MSLKKLLDTAPKEPGVYMITNEDTSATYIGSSGALLALPSWALTYLSESLVGSLRGICAFLFYWIIIWHKRYIAFSINNEVIYIIYDIYL